MSNQLYILPIYYEVCQYYFSHKYLDFFNNFLLLLILP
ncbi:putative 2-dehydropantoate 2-reductase [Clostridium botulinum Bf]|nr:putative 2-dehydropantoate 2-reductase [Clostridium botulinum Bf]